MSFVHRPLANVKYLPRTLNLYKTLVPNPNERGTLTAFGWEEPNVRIANTVTWLLTNARREGLPSRQDGYVRVSDLLQHPELGGLDFRTLEKMVQRFRSEVLKLNYEPTHVSGSQVDCWWIGIRKVVNPQAVERRRLVDVPLAIYTTRPSAWPRIRKEGISRESDRDITFATDAGLPLHYAGDNTFIHLNTSQALKKELLPLYSNVKRKDHNRRLELITTPAANISPSIFESAMRVVVQKFPLLRKEETPYKGQVPQLTVNPAGVRALKRLGYGDVVEQSIRNKGLLDCAPSNREVRREIGGNRVHS